MYCGNLCINPKMKKSAFFILSLFFLFTSAFAQTPKGNGKISGLVIDTETNLPVEFANVALVDPKTGKPVDGAVCDNKGKFTINKVADGMYTVAISFIGYETKNIENIELADKKNDLDLGTIKVGTSAKVLGEVVVEGQKQLIEERVDRTIYNAENDVTSRGGDATDVLRRVPLLSVDLDGNVSMRGNSNITVLINNKPSTITASSVADALRQIPADQIKTVEVITSPSAKYDAEGSAGIINIVTKKNTLEGATLNIDAGAGLRGSNLGLNGNYRKGKMGFSLGGFGRASYNVKGSFENDQITKSNGYQNIQKADTRNNNLFGRYTLGWDYDINKNNYIAASVRYGVRNGNNYQDALTRQSYDDLGNPISNEVRDTETTDNSGNIDISLDFTHLYAKPQQEISFSSQYSRNNRNNDFLNTIYDNTLSVDSLIKNLNKSFNEEITVQVDYQSPISTNQLVEVGAKNIMRKVTSDYKYFGASSDGEFVPTTTALSANIFNYNQNVTAAYLAYTLSMKSGYSLKAGARYEYTMIEADFADTDFENPEAGTPEIPSYGILVPSVNLSKKLKNGNTLKLAYNRRIQRPSIQFLNPNINASNPLNITVGNPNLDPEYTNNYELGYSTFIKGTTLNFSAFIRNTTGSIQSVREVKGDTIVTFYQNIGQEDAYGLNFFANVNIGKKLTVNGGGDVYYAVLDNNLTDPKFAASNQGWVASGRLFGTYNVGKGWGFQFMGMYRGNKVQLQGSQGGFGYYSFGIKKELANKKGSVGFAAENFLSSSMKIRNYTETPSISQKSLNEMYNLSFRITFSYRIGKMSFDAPRPRRKKSVNNDDLKDGGSGEGMDMNGGQQSQQRGNAAMMMAPAATQKQPATVTTTPNTTKATVDATGIWAYAMETQMGTTTGKLTIKKEGDVYSGTVFNSRNNQEIPLTSVTVSGNELTATYTANFGGNEVPVTIKGPITGDDLDAIMSIGQMRTMPLKATRTK